jgi:carbamoyl-phosphate synthase large subunit
MTELAVGRHLADAFHLVPPGSDPAFADMVLEICRAEQVDAVLPQSSVDLLGLAEARERFEGIAVLVSSPDAIRRSNDKAETYALLENIGVRGPAWRRVAGPAAVAAAARELGYPEVNVCMKPVFSSGSRGFRVLSASADRHAELLANRPGVASAIQLEELLELLPEEGGPELLVMELATGRERTIDGIAIEGRIALGHPKTREAMRAGLAMYFETLDDPQLMETAQKIVAELRLDHFFNIQLVGEHVIEINPRISTIVYQEDLNIPYLGIKHALGEISEEELGALASRIRPTRKALRYFDQIEWDDS